MKIARKSGQNQGAIYLQNCQKYTLPFLKPSLPECGRVESGRRPNKRTPTRERENRADPAQYGRGSLSDQTTQQDREALKLPGGWYLIYLLSDHETESLAKAERETGATQGRGEDRKT